MAPYGYQWFSSQDRSREAVLGGVRAAAPILDAFIDEALAERGLAPSDLALVGFSQGTMMSLFVGLRRAEPVAGIVGFSGRLLAPDLLAAELRSRPPVLLVHGSEDPLVPYTSLADAEAALKGPMFRSRPRPPSASATRSTRRGCGAAARFSRKVLNGTTP